MMPEILPNGNIRISIPVTIKTQGGRKRIVAQDVSRLTGCESPLLLNLAIWNRYSGCLWSPEHIRKFVSQNLD